MPKNSERKTYKAFNASLGVVPIASAFPPAGEPYGTQIYDEDSDTIYIRVEDPSGTPIWRAFPAAGGSASGAADMFVFAGNMIGAAGAKTGYLANDATVDPTGAADTVSPLAHQYPIAGVRTQARIDLFVTENELTGTTTYELVRNGSVVVTAGNVPATGTGVTLGPLAAAFAAGERVDLRLSSATGGGGAANRVLLSAVVRLF